MSDNGKMESMLIPYQAVHRIECRSALVFAPHPDDEIFGCGGAIIRYVDSGVSVQVIVVTDGCYGASESERHDLSLVRQGESIEAARILGYGMPIFWDLRDREVVYSELLVSRILRALEGFDLVYAPSIYEIHPDHRAIGMAVVEAVRRIGQGASVALYEVGSPLRPNLLLDISDIAEKKMLAMRCFVSQNQKQRYDLDIAALNRYRSYTLPPEVSAAEAYVYTTGEDLAKDPLAVYESEYRRQRKIGLQLSGTDEPLVSVIVRSMDRPTLCTALDSVALQTYQKIEVILVCAKGSSHSEVPEWCGRFPMRAVNTGEPLARARAANLGLEEASGEYAIFLDDDDWYEPHHIAALTGAFDDTVVAVYSAIRVVNEHGDEVKRFEEPYDAVQLRIDNFMPIHAVLFRRAVLDRGVFFDEGLEVCEDWDFWLQMAEQGTFKFVPEVGGCYRLDQGSGSGVWDDPLRTRLVMTRIYKKWLPRLGDATLWSIFEYARFRRLYYDRDRQCKQDLTDLRGLLETTERKLNEVRAHLVTTHTELNSVRQRGEQWQREIELLRQELQERDAKIAEMRSSTSWKITAPVRSVGRFLGRDKRPPRAVSLDKASPPDSEDGR